MSSEAKWENGDSVLPQSRTARNIEWSWANGDSGNIGADEYVESGGSVTFLPWIMRHHFIPEFIGR